ncbi:MAG: histidine kinase [Sulfurimonas sp.]|nr:MAG: histidine kinase [Sulfurimonas sp.]
MPILTPDYSTLSHEDMASAIGLKLKHIPMLITSFLQETPPILQALEDAIDSKDYTAIKEHSHALKGSAGNLRFDDIYKMSKDLELAGSDTNKDFEYTAYLQALKDAVATIPTV